MKRIALVAAALSAMLAASAWAGQSPKQRDANALASFERYAAPPQRSMHYFRLDNFQYLGKNAQREDAIAVWTGVNQVYLLTLEKPCIGLDFAFAIGLTSTSGDVNAGMDYVKYSRNGPQQCRIMTIQKVDYKALRAEKAQGVDDVRPKDDSH
ncbi:MAG TPA: DUF6491 family protein [Rhodanobacteraceae bacterium]